MEVKSKATCLPSNSHKTAPLAIGREGGVPRTDLILRPPGSPHCSHSWSENRAWHQSATVDCRMEYNPFFHVGLLQF